MTNNNPIVLAQKRKGNTYNDLVGRVYHFPKKYSSLVVPGARFIYFDPSAPKQGAYFGAGKILRIVADNREPDHFLAEISEFRPFVEDVLFASSSGKPRETAPFYNAQNAVRRLAEETYNSIIAAGGLVLSFTADAHLLRVLGQELISTESVGVLELIKNAYDANAKRCRVRIEKIPGIPLSGTEEFAEFAGPVIVIEDNGSGMDLDDIQNGWLRPASTLKTTIKDRLRAEKRKAISLGTAASYDRLVRQLKAQHKGRLPLGEKGVGRFATNRLGRRLLLTTKPAGWDKEFVLEIDWNDFESGGEAKSLESIGVKLTSRSPSRDYGPADSGTRLVIYEGREDFPLTKDRIIHIYDTIKKLRSPDDAPENFAVDFECPQLEGELGELKAPEYPPPFVVEAEVDSAGKAQLTVSFRPPRNVPIPKQDDVRRGRRALDLIPLIKPEHRKAWYTQDSPNEARPARCGPFKLSLKVWYRSKPWIDGPHANRFTQHLDEFGGISIYRDGLNIFPAEWGAERDWLHLSKRHIKKGENISYYNMIGSIDLKQESNIELRDKTDREGMLDNVAFIDLADLARAIVLYVETHFKGRREEYTKLTKGLLRQPVLLAEASRRGAQVIDRVAQGYDFARDPFELFEGSDGGVPERRRELLGLTSSLKKLEKSLEVIQEVQDQLTEQAGYGLSVAVALHEITKLTNHFYAGTIQILQSGKFRAEEFQELKDSAEFLRTELHRLGPLRATRNEPAAIFNISKAIAFCKAIHQGECEREGIKLVVEQAGDFKVLARYGAVNQVINNLIDNSRYWLTDDRILKKEIRIVVDAERRSVLLADSGPNIDESIRPYLFEPGYSLRVPPSGLGLYVCKYYMRSLGGEIHESSEFDRIEGLAGAQFVLDFSRVPSAEGLKDV